MKKNKKKRKTIIFSITTILLLVMVYVSLHLERRVNFLENGVKSITSVLSSAVMIPFKAFNSEKNEIDNKKNIIDVSAFVPK